MFGRTIVFNSMNKATAEPISISSVSSVYSGGSQVTVPSNAASGDVIVLFQYSRGNLNGLQPTAVTPTGMTSINNTGYNVLVSGNIFTVREMTSYAIIGSGSGINANTVLTGMNGATLNNKYLFLMKMNKPATTLSNILGPTGNVTAPYSHNVSISSLSTSGALICFDYFTTLNGTNWGNSSYISMNISPNVIVNPGSVWTYPIYSIQNASRPSSFAGAFSSLATGWNVSITGAAILIN